MGSPGYLHPLVFLPIMGPLPRPLPQPECLVTASCWLICHISASPQFFRERGFSWPHRWGSVSPSCAKHYSLMLTSSFLVRGCHLHENGHRVSLLILENHPPPPGPAQCLPYSRHLIILIEPWWFTEMSLYSSFIYKYIYVHVSVCDLYSN